MQSRHLVLGRRLGRFLLGLDSRTRLAHLSREFWSREQIVVGEISQFGEVAGHSGTYTFYSFVARGHAADSSQKSHLCRLYLR